MGWEGDGMGAQKNNVSIMIHNQMNELYRLLLLVAHLHLQIQIVEIIKVLSFS